MKYKNLINRLDVDFFMGGGGGGGRFFKKFRKFCLLFLGRTISFSELSGKYYTEPYFVKKKIAPQANKKKQVRKAFLSTFLENFDQKIRFVWRPELRGEGGGCRLPRHGTGSFISTVCKN